MALCQQDGWTPEPGEAAGDFGGWEDGERTETSAEMGVMQPEMPRWAGGAAGGELHIPEREARWQCGCDGVPGSLPVPLSLSDGTKSPHTKSPSVSTLCSRQPGAGQRSTAAPAAGTFWGDPA